MLIDPETDQFDPNRLKRVSIIGIPAGALLVLILVSVFSDSASSASASALPSQNLTLLASQLFSDYLLPFEVTSILVLVAVMGAIVLTKRPDSK
jgi:NADH-quinone oxidoreductase subunit J